MTQALKPVSVVIGDLVAHPANVRARSPESYASENIAHLKASGQLEENLATHGRIVDGIERRDLEAAGLSPSKVEVDADAGGSWLSRHAAEQQAGQQARQDAWSRGGGPHEPAGWSRPGGRPADSGSILSRTRSAH